MTSSQDTACCSRPASSPPSSTASAYAAHVSAAFSLAGLSAAWIAPSVNWEQQLDLDGFHRLTQAASLIFLAFFVASLWQSGRADDRRRERCFLVLAPLVVCQICVSNGQAWIPATIACGVLAVLCIAAMLFAAGKAVVQKRRTVDGCIHVEALLPHGSAWSVLAISAERIGLLGAGRWFAWVAALSISFWAVSTFVRAPCPMDHTRRGRLGILVAVPSTLSLAFVPVEPTVARLVLVIAALVAIVVLRSETDWKAFGSNPSYWPYVFACSTLSQALWACSVTCFGGKLAGDVVFVIGNALALWILVRWTVRPIQPSNGVMAS